MEPEILILGAGLSGLAAAQRLGQAGIPVAILEARDRIGGRVWTRHHPDVPYPIELGAEWIDIHGNVPRLIEARGFRLQKSRGHRYVRGPGGLERNDAPYDKRILQELYKLGRKDRAVRPALGRCCDDGSWGEAPVALIRYIEGFHAADPDSLSLRWLLEVEKNQSADQSAHRTPDGAGRCAESLAAGLSEYCTLHLDTIVRAVRWRRGSVIVEADTRSGAATFEARAAIVTLPLPVLKAPPSHPFAVRFTPGLSSKRGALEKLAMGQVLKVTLLFREQFWRGIGSLDDMLFLQDYTQPFPTWWSMTPADAPLLSGWAGGPVADRLAGTSDPGLLDAAVDSLAGALGVPRSRVEEQLVSGHLHDWREDPWAMGCYSNVLVGGIDAWKTLARPLDQTLFFAGEATCGKGMNATMDGAPESGWRAGAEAIRATGANPVVSP